jgi:hypothetical protein
MLLPLFRFSFIILFHALTLVITEYFVSATAFFLWQLFIAVSILAFH